MCQVGGRQNTFICPVGTLFDQRYLVCNWSNQVNCRNSVEFYNINRKIYKPTS
uniref:Chitin-binding type-2 domain-containing protein n=2 Tax=Lepeophtheirus salmonis TaxID=72036 RepID=A0A0K2T9S1_LEPSM